ncbi:MAG: hypothetical protein AAGE01_05005 [Pseudomonadota bacterium]
MKQSPNFRAIAAVSVIVFMLAGCESFQRRGIDTTPLRPTDEMIAEARATEAQPAVDEAPVEEPRTRFVETPPSRLGNVAAQETVDPPAVIEADGAPVTLALDSVPLPAAINEIYGNLLGQNFQLDDAIRTAEDLVTLRIPEPVSREELVEIGARVLADYGVGIVRDGAVLRFDYDAESSGSRPPLLVSGRTLPDVPLSHRTVFQVYPLQVVGVQIANQLSTALLRGIDVQVTQLPFLNAMLLSGMPEAVRAAAATLSMVDRPSMKGRYSVRIEPVFVEPEALAERLITVLKAEGYAASDRVDFAGAITVLGMNEVGAVFIFAGATDTLARAREWADSLDQPGSAVSSGQTLFYYPVQRTSAINLRDVLVQMLGGAPPLREERVAGAGAGGAARGARGDAQELTGGAGTLTDGQSLVVDEVRNALLYRGSAEQWYALLPIIREMDQPAKQVLIEVLVAEVTLTDEIRSGFEWFAKGGIGDLDGAGGTLGNLGLGGAGLVYTLDNGGEIRARLNAFARDDRVTILSSPRIMVKSGEPASINVGTEVPLITSQSTAPDLNPGTGSILQEVQYRTTGVRLDITPLIHSGNQVDVIVVQEVSEAQPNDVSSVPSPTIFNRSVSTNLTLRDGGSVLLGGLISRSISRGESGVPLLKDIPLAGRLFRVEGETDIRTELMVLLTPYVLDSAEDAERITDAFRGRLGEVEPVLRRPSQDSESGDPR